MKGIQLRSDLYPVLIFQTRYQGTYEGGKWAAMARRVKVPAGATADDVTCSCWWAQRLEKIGAGQTPDEAYEDLCKKRPEKGTTLDIVVEGSDELFASVEFDAFQWRLIEQAASQTHRSTENFVLSALRQLVDILQEPKESNE